MRITADALLVLFTGSEAVGFAETKYNKVKGHPDIELVFGAGGLTGDIGNSLRISLNLNATVCQSIYGPYEGRLAVPMLKYIRIFLIAIFFGE